MSVTVSDGMSDGGAWVSVTEAAHLARVSERTVQRWIEAGRVMSDVSDEGRRRVRRETLPTPDRPQASSGSMTDSGSPLVGRVSVTSDASDTSMSDVAECRTSNPASQDLTLTAATTRAEAAERERDRLAEEVRFLRAQVHHAQAAGEVPFLRDQLDRARIAEEQLRVLLGQAQRTIQEMAQRPALPPASEVKETPSRVRWWMPWRRG